MVRPLSVVPTPVRLLLALGLCAQLIWHFQHPPTSPRAEHLPQPVSLLTLKIASLGEPIGLSKALLLYLQTFDDQPGVSGAFRRLDYGRLQTWLDLNLQLDPLSTYPLFLASRIYGAVGDASKERQMFEFVYRHFFDDPNRRWDPLAFAAVMSKHRLNDLPQAHRYAEAIRTHATGENVPSWARQMDIFILEDMKEYKTAYALLDSLLQSGEVTDANEVHFLQARLNQLETKLTP